MFSILSAILGFGKDAIGKISQTSDKAKEQQTELAKAQTQLTQAEIQGAPASFLRLWRSALGWVLVFCFVWEVIGRAIITTYFPEAWLPPSVLKEITSLLLGMLGLGI